MKMKKQIKTYSVTETMQLGEQFGQSLSKGCLISLAGDLGVGKTAFTKGLAKGLNISETISSPTFTILKEYDGRLNLKHIDAYRLEGVSSDAIGLFDLLDDENVVVLEWGKYLDDLDFKIDYLITLDYDDENERTITIEELN